MSKKRIVFCADGTWAGVSSNTNVYKLYKSLTVSSAQMPFYDDGIGANQLPLQRLVGGAFGEGIWAKIKEGYTKIAHVYEQDDDVFIFGFSRGAYTARSLAGMIAACGLPTKNFSDDLVETAFDAYRDKNNRQAKLEKLAACNMYCSKIKMIGVWDTVGALGIPAIFSGVDPIAYGFLDTELHPDVLNAYHALSIDEQRCEFRPTLWKESTVPGQVMEQVWFCGVHSDVGGGEPDVTEGAPALADITLSWMMDKASRLGLQFDPAAQKQYADPLDPKYALAKLHSSWSIVWGPPVHRSLPANACIADSVLFRYKNDQTWRPANLQTEAGALASAYQLISVLQERSRTATA